MTVVISRGDIRHPAAITLSQTSIAPLDDQNTVEFDKHLEVNLAALIAPAVNKAQRVNVAAGDAGVAGTGHEYDGVAHAEQTSNRPALCLTDQRTQELRLAGRAIACAAGPVFSTSS